MNGGRAESSNTVPVELLGMRNFQQKRSVYVLRVLDKVIVVGATDAAMQTLTEIGDAKSMKKLDAVLAEAERPDARPKWFSWGKSNDETVSMPFAGLLARHMNMPAPAGKTKKLSR
jgi:flagellar biogenesis protein FliO